MRELHFGLTYQRLRWILHAREYSNDRLGLDDCLEERVKSIMKIGTAALSLKGKALCSSA